MDFMKKTLNQVNVQKNTLYDIIYDLFFFFMSFLLHLCYILFCIFKIIFFT